MSVGHHNAIKMKVGRQKLCIAALNSSLKIEIGGHGPHLNFLINGRNIFMVQVMELC